MLGAGRHILSSLEQTLSKKLAQDQQHTLRMAETSRLNEARDYRTGRDVVRDEQWGKNFGLLEAREGRDEDRFEQEQLGWLSPEQHARLKKNKIAGSDLGIQQQENILEDQEYNQSTRPSIEQKQKMNALGLQQQENILEDQEYGQSTRPSVEQKQKMNEQQIQQNEMAQQFQQYQLDKAEREKLTALPLDKQRELNELDYKSKQLEFSIAEQRKRIQDMQENSLPTQAERQKLLKLEQDYKQSQIDVNNARAKALGQPSGSTGAGKPTVAIPNPSSPQFQPFMHNLVKPAVDKFKKTIKPDWNDWTQVFDDRPTIREVETQASQMGREALTLIQQKYPNLTPQQHQSLLAHSWDAVVGQDEKLNKWLEYYGDGGRDGVRNSFLNPSPESGMTGSQKLNEAIGGGGTSGQGVTGDSLNTAFGFGDIGPRQPGGPIGRRPVRRPEAAPAPEGLTLEGLQESFGYHRTPMGPGGAGQRRRLR